LLNQSHDRSVRARQIITGAKSASSRKAMSSVEASGGGVWVSLACKHVSRLVRAARRPPSVLRVPPAPGGCDVGAGGS
jgi:hypothetical protein